MIRDLLINIFF